MVNEINPAILFYSIFSIFFFFQWPLTRCLMEKRHWFVVFAGCVCVCVCVFVGLSEALWLGGFAFMTLSCRPTWAWGARIVSLSVCLDLAVCNRILIEISTLFLFFYFVLLSSTIRWVSGRGNLAWCHQWTDKVLKSSCDLSLLSNIPPGLRSQVWNINSNLLFAGKGNLGQFPNYSWGFNRINNHFWYW